MSNKEVSVGLVIKGDSSGATEAIAATEKILTELQATGEKTHILEGDAAVAENLALELEKVQAQMRAMVAASQNAGVPVYALESVDTLAQKMGEAAAEARTTASAIANMAAEETRAAINADTLNSAFNTLGIKPLQEVKTEIEKIQAALATVKSSGVIGADQDRAITAFNAKLADLRTQITSLSPAVERVNAAFSAFGIRSAAQIEADILEINQELIKLASQTNLSGAEFNRAFAAGQARIAELRAELEGTPAQIDRISQRAGMLSEVMGNLAAVYSGIELAREFIKANVAMETMTRTLTQLKGGSEAAAAEIDYVRTTANRLGLDIESTSHAYIGLIASAKGTAMEGQKTRDVFEAVSGAMAKLGKGSADTEGALLAVSQMMSKGVVSMEEMRQQLGERLPGAMQATADASGVTVAELNTMIESGKVMASDLLPLLAEGLEKMYGTSEYADGSIAAWNRLKNAVADTFVFIGDSGVWKAIVAILGQVAIAVRGLTGAFELLGKIFGITAGAIASFDWKHPIDSVRNWKIAVSEAADEIQKKLDKANEGAKGAADGQKKLADASNNTSQAASNQSASWMSVVNSHVKVAESTKEATTLALKSAAAVEEEGKASIALAQAFGNETEKREAAKVAAANNARVLDDVAKARQDEAAEAERYARALVASAGPEAESDANKRKAIQTAQESAQVKQKEAEQSEAQALGARQHAAAMEAEVEAAKDNSGRTEELRAAYDAAKLALEKLRNVSEGYPATAKQVKEAEIEVGKAAFIYRDALHDQTTAIEANARLKQANISIDQAGIRLAIEIQKGIYQTAKAQGDEVAATQASNEIKRLEIQMAMLVAKAKQAEAESGILVGRAKIEEIRGSGPMTAAKEAEIKAIEASIKVKEIEAKIAGVSARSLEDLRKATEDAGNAANGAAGSFSVIGESAQSSVPGVNNLAGSLNNAADAAARLRQEQNGGSGGGGGVVQGSDGVYRNEAGQHTDKNGVVQEDVNGKPITNSTSILDDPAVRNRAAPLDIATLMYKRDASATAKEVETAQKYYSELYARGAATKLTGNLGDSDNAARLTNQVINESIDQSLQLARKELSTGQAIDLGTSVNDLVKANLARTNWFTKLTPESGSDAIIAAYKKAGNEATQQTTAAMTTVNINLNGKSAQITTSPQDATTLANFLRQLESDASRAY